MSIVDYCSTYGHDYDASGTCMHCYVYDPDRDVCHGVCIPPQSKATTVNPKDLQGTKKVSFTKLPAVAVAHGAHAMMDGAKKYGPYNWRDKDVIASIYVDAACRHLLNWFEGEEEAEDSGVHHLGHAIACCAVLLDAQETGNLIDDRPVNDQTKAVLSKVLARLSKKIVEKVEKNEKL